MNRFPKFLVSVVFPVAFLGLVCSCDFMDNMAPGNMKNVHIVILNGGSRELFDSSVTLGKYIASAGILPAGKKATHQFFNHPITEFATVYFEIEGEGSFTRTVGLQKYLPERMDSDLTIVFKINSDDRTVDVEVRKGL